MKIIRDKFSSVARTIASMVPGNPIVPINAHMVLVEKNGQLVITSQSDSAQLTIATGIPVQEGLKFTAPAKKLSEMAAAMTSEEMDIDPSENHLTIKGGRSRFKLPTLPFSEYPFYSFLQEKGDMTVKLPREALLAAISKVAPASPKNDARQYLNGIYFSIQENVLTLVATDGHRLHRAKVELSDPASEEGKTKSAIVSAKVIPTILQVLEGQADQVILRLTRNTATFRSGNVMLVCKLIDGTYPDYQRVIPRNQDAWFQVNRSEIAGLMKMSALAADDKNQIAVLSTNGGLTITSRAENGEDFVGTIDQAIVSREAKAAFSIPYLSATLGAIDSDEIQIRKNFDQEDETGALVVREEYLDFLALIMPIRIS